MIDFIYDDECYPNFFSVTIINPVTLDLWRFEISPRRDDSTALYAMLYWITANGHRMVGFNNVGYDYPMLHYFMEHYLAGVNYVGMNNENNRIIDTPFHRRFDNRIAPWKILIPQVDLFMIHNFDNVSRSTSLKMLEFNMQSVSVQDLPFPPGTVLTSDQMDTLLTYNEHDVRETMKFYHHSKSMLDFRDELTARYNQDFTNYSNPKIGEKYFEMKLEETLPGSCYIKTPSGKVRRQTIRDVIPVNEIIFPYVSFQHPEFNRILDYFRSQNITETKGVFDKLNCEVYSLTYHFGAGGIHASVEAQTVRSDETFVIKDIDVTSYYPSLAIANNLHPAHLGAEFCDVYEGLKKERLQHAKGSSINAMLKLGLNAVYGKSNSHFSSFFDSQYTMAITINGQLLMCMLAELLLPIRDLTIVQVNTDGLTVHCPRDVLPQVQSACDWWQSLTLLTLEDDEYSAMFIRDVNNYLAISATGKVKRKGAYQYLSATTPGKAFPEVLDWNQNHSCLIVGRAACEVLLNGADAREFITGWHDPYDFMLRAKVPRTSKLMWGDQQQQNTSRYFISHGGQYLTKFMPPLARTGKTEMRKFAINKGYTVTMCNNMTTFDRSLINFDWYVEQVNKLTEPLK